MSEISENISAEKANLKFEQKLPKADVVQQTDARAVSKAEYKPKTPENDIPTKKRKTRRGKSKRRQPYAKYGRKYSKIIKSKIIKPEAPHNSNQFLLEDHGVIEELDENLKCVDQVSTSTLTRTRDSSFSVDSDGEFYSSPDDEEQFLMQDFNDQYKSIQAEQLQTMSKSELINEYISLENRYQQEQLARRTQKQKDLDSENNEKLQREVEKLKNENEKLQRENEILRNKVASLQNCDSDSEDSETDSSDSCSSSSSNGSNSCGSRSKSSSPVMEDAVDYSQTNGHISPHASVDPV